MSLASRLTFLRRYLSQPGIIGALAPSSRHLAAALTAPFAECTRAAHVLEVGAGTGAVTRQIIRHLKPADHLDVCEISPELAGILERDVLGAASLAEARAQGRVRLLCGPVEDFEAPGRYDFVIAGLPFTAFPVDQTREILGVIERSLKPGGVFTYFEYVGLRTLANTLALGAARRRVQEMSRYMSGRIATHQVGRRTVLWNLPPAYARCWQFSAEAAAATPAGRLAPAAAPAPASATA